MANIDTLIQDFLAQKKIAVVGVSEKREGGCNLAYTKFKDAGYQVYPVNPHITTFKGTLGYPNLKSIPEKPQAVFIMTNPGVTQQIVLECAELGVNFVWMHCMMGTKPGLASSITSVSPGAVSACHASGIKVIPGSCPNQFLKPAFGHKLMRGLFGLLGFLPGE